MNFQSGEGLNDDHLARRVALDEAGDSPIVLAEPLTGDALVLVRAEVYRKMLDLLEEEEDRRK